MKLLYDVKQKGKNRMQQDIRCLPSFPGTQDSKVHSWQLIKSANQDYWKHAEMILNVALYRKANAEAQKSMKAR